MSFLINPYAFLAAGGDFESIATVTVGAGGASSIEFTSIPGTYQHLQIRYIARSDRSAAGDKIELTINSDTGSNYAFHTLKGTGSSAASSGYATQSVVELDESLTAASNTADIFAAGVIDLLDYASASKNSTLRALHGRDTNGAGTIGITSGLWIDTDAVTSIKLAPSVGPNFIEHSTAALFGIKA